MSVVDRIVEVPGNATNPGFAHAVVATGRVAYVSGQVSIDADGELVAPGDLARQTEQALTNLHRIIATMGADWSDVVKLSWYVTDATQVQTIRDVRDRLLRPAVGDRPNAASTLIQVAALFRPDVLIEVEAVVALPD
jgi:enamine deaminase RidA (YjgF/YER057c/UK114 family)